MIEAQEVLEYWFREDTRPRWFEPSFTFDQECRERLGALFSRAEKGELDHWTASAEGCLALCILLDQVPRNIFRGQPRAFATDAKAPQVAEHALSRGFDRALSPERWQFLYLPFMHSEDLAHQERAVALYEASDLPEGREYARGHAEIIRRFGRFPHRNALLGRTSTPAEVAFLREHADDYGQTAQERGRNTQGRERPPDARAHAPLDT